MMDAGQIEILIRVDNGQWLTPKEREVLHLAVHAVLQQTAEAELAAQLGLDEEAPR